MRRERKKIPSGSVPRPVVDRRQRQGGTAEVPDPGPYEYIRNDDRCKLGGSGGGKVHLAVPQRVVR